MPRTRLNDGYVTTVGWCKNEMDHSLCGIPAVPGVVDVVSHKWFAEEQCILRSVVGSTLHGTEIEGKDDRDEMGVCVEPPEYIVGLKHFEQYIHRDRPEGVRSEPGDLDLVIYSLRKYCRLALSGNPTILLLLFAPNPVIGSEWGARLQELAHAFVAKTVANPFIGYMTAQMQRLVGERGQKRIKRPELEAEHGFDTKYASHVIRLGFQGSEILRTGVITLPMPSRERDYVLAIRRGEINLDYVLTKAGLLRKEIETAKDESPLPDRPDADAVNKFLIDAYTGIWQWRNWMWPTNR